MSLPAFGEKDTAVVSMARIDPASGFFAGVFEKQEQRMNLPQVLTHFRISAADPSTDKLLTLENGDPFLLSRKWQNALVFLFTSPLMARHNNFTRHALFVPAFYRIAILSTAEQPPYYNLNPDVMIAVRGRFGDNDQPPHITGKSALADVIPEKRTVNNLTMLFPRNQLTAPGFYSLNYDGRELLPLAFNYSRLESDLTYYDAASLREKAVEKGWKKMKVIGDTGETIRSQVQLAASHNQLWKLFILLALVFFLAECLLLRFLR